MRELSNKVGLLSITIVVMLMLVPTNVSAQTRTSNIESMDTSVFDVDASVTDITVGQTAGGQPWDTSTNFHDLRAIWRANDDVQVSVDVTAENDGDEDGESNHIYSLEVYKEATWVAQGNPEYLDSFQVQLDVDENDGDTLTVTISALDCLGTAKWLVRYACEGEDLDQVGAGPPFVKNAENNYWIVLQ
jgi:hypothetical protein